MNFYQLNEMHFGENHGAMWSSPLRLDRLLASLGQCSPGVLLYFLRNDVVRAGDVVIARNRLPVHRCCIFAKRCPPSPNKTRTAFAVRALLSILTFIYH